MTEEIEDVHFKAQSGPQFQFLSTPADIAIYGGAAGGGKTYALLLKPLRYLTGEKAVKGYGGVIFRRLTTQVRAKGGLWDESENIYATAFATPLENTLEWKFPPFGNSLNFAHLEYDQNVYGWQGAAIPYMGFDELTHFTRKQFFYMISRNRSTCGIRPCIRATTNPDADSWVAEFIAWWIDQETGLPILDRAGSLRWFIRIEDSIVWADTPEDLVERHPGQRPLSVTFIPATLADNKILEEKDPDYRAKLMALSLVERERLLNGNWKVKPTAGMVFKREWFPIVNNAPASSNKVRYWDMAATRPSSKNKDPDWTVGLLMSETAGRYCVLDVFRTRNNPGEVEQDRIAITAQDGYEVRVREEQEGGSSGKTVVHNNAQDTFAGYDYRGVPATGSKEVRARLVATAAYNGLLSLVEGEWNEALLAELNAFPEGAHDDQVDTIAGAFNDLILYIGQETSDSPIADDRLSVPSFSSSDWSDGIPGF